MHDTHLCSLFCFTSGYIPLSSLDWDKYKWTKIGDEGTTALADLRVIKNLKILE